MPYLDLLQHGVPTPARLDGLSVLGRNPDREPGRTLAHPWRGRQVDSPAGPGRLIWTDGYRAAISTTPNVAYFVDLEQVRLAEKAE